MSHATSVLARSRRPSPARSAAASIRIAAFVMAIVLVVALAVAFIGAWLAGDAPDLYANLPSFCASEGGHDMQRVDAAGGAAGTEAPGWADVVRSISAARGTGQSTSHPASRGKTD